MIGNGTMVDILTYFVGQPQDDMQNLILYATSNVLVLILFFAVIVIIYTLVSSVRK
jgi:hypothetical protein